MLARILQLHNKTSHALLKIVPRKNNSVWDHQEKGPGTDLTKHQVFQPIWKICASVQLDHFPQGSAWRYYIYSWNLHTAGFTSNFFWKKKLHLVSVSAETLEPGSILPTGQHKSRLLARSRGRGRWGGASTGSCGRLGGAIAKIPGQKQQTEMVESIPLFEVLHPQKA